MTAAHLSEPPTLTNKRESIPHPSETDTETVAESIPLDVVPVLAVPRTEVPWKELSELAAQLVRRIDGHTHAMSLVIETDAPPNESIRELAGLASRGLVRWALS
jgi:hypothetical protein